MLVDVVAIDGFWTSRVGDRLVYLLTSTGTWAGSCTGELYEPLDVDGVNSSVDNLCVCSCS
jgi:hypothetical protein